MFVFNYIFLLKINILHFFISLKKVKIIELNYEKEILLHLNNTKKYANCFTQDKLNNHFQFYHENIKEQLSKKQF